MKRFLKIAALAGAVLIAAGPSGQAAGEAHHPRDAGFSFASLFGTFDRAAAQRGLQVYKEVCSNCHSMRLLSYRNIVELGLTEAQARAFAATFTVTDGPNDEGAMFERPARLSDRFRRPHANDAAARLANNGALPPDLSVIVKARHDGANYIYSLLTGYGQEPPAGVTVGDGMNYNPYFPGGQIAMGQVLNDDQIEYTDGTNASADQMARDVTTFLAWASEPETEARRRMGIRVLVFLAIAGLLAYGVKRKIWAELKAKSA
jgi:ubiquinol-cytochrome c reductase cytochrome c1 subunit